MNEGEVLDFPFLFLELNFDYFNSLDVFGRFQKIDFIFNVNNQNPGFELVSVENVFDLNGLTFTGHNLEGRIPGFDCLVFIFHNPRLVCPIEKRLYVFIFLVLHLESGKFSSSSVEKVS
jgi:hypothetical protein